MNADLSPTDQPAEGLIEFSRPPARAERSEPSAAAVSRPATEIAAPHAGAVTPTREYVRDTASREFDGAADVDGY